MLFRSPGEPGVFDKQKAPLSWDVLLGARRGIRTPDRLVKSQLLYQLSYARSACKIATFDFSSAVLDAVLFVRLSSLLDLQSNLINFTAPRLDYGLGG